MIWGEILEEIEESKERKDSEGICNKINLMFLYMCVPS